MLRTLGKLWVFPGASGSPVPFAIGPALGFGQCPDTSLALYGLSLITSNLQCGRPLVPVALPVKRENSMTIRVTNQLPNPNKWPAQLRRTVRLNSIIDRKVML